MPDHILKEKKGSVSLEAAILLPLIIILFVVFICLINCVIAQDCINQSLYKTADFMSRYAFVYNEKGMKTLEKKVFEKIDELISEYIESEKIRDKIYQYIDFNKLVEYTDDLIYRQIALGVFHIYLNESELYKKGLLRIEDITFEESKFFNSNDDIVLKVKAKSGMFHLKSAIRIGCWIGGKFDSSIVSSDNVWDMDNFTRGRTLRDIFGGTLPYDYPVIAAYSNGTGISIKSIDHTAASYQTGNHFEMTIRQMIDKLADYKGDNNRPVTSRILILVMPENKMNINQNSSMSRIISYANTKNVFLDIQLYQESKK
ncbi:MAG: hypothetical protein E7385_06055 [Ruminococcaceae bacterium]|nr:hypothetical protein [Oscillospiraceae bacterium]